MEVMQLLVHSQPEKNIYLHGDLLCHQPSDSGQSFVKTMSKLNIHFDTIAGGRKIVPDFVLQTEVFRFSKSTARSVYT